MSRSTDSYRQKLVKQRALHVLNEAEKSLSYLREQTGPDFLKCVDLLRKNKGKIVTCGVGKSSFVAMKMAATLTSVGREAVFIHPTDAFHGDSGVIKNSDILLCFSFSGESNELLHLISYAKKIFNVKAITLTGNVRSRLAKLSDATLNIKIDKEGSPLSLAPMASISASLVASDMLVSALVDPKFFSKDMFAKFHPGGSLGLKLKRVGDFMERGKHVSLVKETQLLQKALVEMTKKGRGVVGITHKDGRLSGIITDGDIRRFFLSHDTHQHTYARDAMTKNPKTITEECSLFDALDIMTRHGISSLFVVSKEKFPIGMIHIHNIVGHTVS
jgi:arabinose-5-phosphate isomerase